MEPRIQYVKTGDGVNIAYGILGEGYPLVSVPNMPFPNLAAWSWPVGQSWSERLAQGRMLVTYDGRGSGLSERNVSDFSLDAFLLDLEAVVDHMQLQKVALLGAIHGGPVAIAYAARHPDRVSRLLLWNAYARGSEFLRDARLKVFRALIDEDWELYTETVASVSLGDLDREEVKRGAALLREGLTCETARAVFAVTDKFDVSGILADVSCPTLVLHRRQAALVESSLARNLAAGIPNARLTLLEGDSHVASVGDSESVLRAVNQFLGEGSEQTSKPELPAGTAIILFADIADSTALTERLGDAAFRAKARELDGALRAAIRERGGTPVEGKLLGDGVLAVFTSAREAIEAAVACGEQGNHAGLPLHLGIHAGDVIREKDPDGRDNVYGGAVNIASRIAGLSAAGEVLVSETVRSLARTSAGVAFEDRGEQELKGVGEKVRVWAVVEAANQQADKPANQGGA